MFSLALRFLLILSLCLWVRPVSSPPARADDPLPSAVLGWDRNIDGQQGQDVTNESTAPAQVVDPAAPLG